MWLRGPLPLYSETMIHSRHSAGTKPDFHTCAKRESHHACTSVAVSGGGRNATVHDLKP